MNATASGTAELDWDLSAALDVATNVVADGSLPCIVFGVIDARGRSEIFALSGPRSDVSDDSVFFIASVTKAIMATALMQYVDEGRLDLHTPLVRYLPGFDGDARQTITAWHVLTHTSGLPDIPPDQLRRERPNYRRLRAEVLAMRPRREPGTRYEYNSAAWVLLSELMVALSNLPWPTVLQHRLLTPLGMVDTTFDARGLRRRVVGIEGANAGNRLVGEVLLWFLARATFPGGGLFGTAADLLRLGWALLRSHGDGRAGAQHGRAAEAEPPRILSHASVARMAEQQLDGIPFIAEDGSRIYLQHGIGWRKTTDGWPGGAAVLTHGGHSGARVWVDPEEGFAFAFLTNVWGVSSDAPIAIVEEVYRTRR